MVKKMITQIQVEWKVNIKTGLTNIDLEDLGCKDFNEWCSLDLEEQKKRLELELIHYDLATIKFIPEDWDK